MADKKKKKKDNNEDMEEGLAQIVESLDTAMQIFQDNVAEVAAPGQVGMGVLPRITLKHAGTVGFGVERVDLEEAEELVTGKKGLDAIILYCHPVRVYWAKPFDEREAEELPTCVSLDAQTGICEGEAPRSCLKCEYARWGTALGGEGRGQACRQRTRMFLLPREEVIPHIFEIPTTSLQVPQKYAVGLAGKRLHTYAVVTHFGATAAKNRDGIEYSRLEMNLVGALPDDAVERLLPMREAVMAMAGSISVGEPAKSEESSEEDPFEDV